MKFSEKYPNHRAGDEIKEGFLKTNNDQVCSICGENTRWLSLSLMGKNACSTECMGKLWEEYSKSLRLKK